MTTVSPGAFRPARRTADFTCAEGIGSVYRTGIGSFAPIIVSGRRPPSRPCARVPKSAKGSVIRPIGRDRSDASPVKVAEISVVAIAPMIRRTPVPALPQSITSSGSPNPPTPTPWTDHSSFSLVTSAPKARMASAVRKTSSPSKRPRIRVLPTDNAPRISDRWLIDLSPGTFAVPTRASALREVIGCGSPWPDMGSLLCSEFC